MAAFQQTIAERGTFTFVGFSYPPRPRRALALVQNTAGVYVAVFPDHFRTEFPVGITALFPCGN